MINLSIKLDTFPLKWKIANIKPEAKNYGPISLLPLISRIIKKLIHDQTQDCLERIEFLHIYQWGFRTNHSTDTCLSRLTDIFLNGAENGKHTGMILIDLQKAFDSLDHEFSLDKIKSIGFSDKTIKWFHSYLTNWAFFVSLDNVFSEARTINCRVPQGSIVGPLFFLLYINDMSQTLSHRQTYPYGDYTSIFYQNKDVAEIENILNRD